MVQEELCLTDAPTLTTTWQAQGPAGMPAFVITACPSADVVAFVSALCTAWQRLPSDSAGGSFWPC